MTRSSRRTLYLAKPDAADFGQISWLAVGTALSRVTGFARTSVLAAAIGLYTVGSAFTVANTIPTVLFTLVAGGVLSAVLVPQMVGHLERGQQVGAAFADRLLTLVTVVLAPLTALAVLGAPTVATLYAGSGWTPQDLALTTAFTAWCMPQVFFYGLFAVLGQILQAHGRPGPMTWAPVANNVITVAVGTIFLVLGSVDAGPTPAAAASVSAPEAALLGGGATAGVAAQVLLLLPALRAAGYRYRPRLDLRGCGLGRSARLAGWTILFVLANQIAYTVTVVVAGTAGKAAEVSGRWAAGVPTYTNAYMVMLVPHAVVAVSIANARLRSMSYAGVYGRRADVGVAVGAALGDAGRVLVPIAAAMAVTGPLLARVLFPGNPENDTFYLGLVLTCFAPAVVIYPAQFLVVRGLQALQDTRRPALVQFVITGLQIAVALALGAILPAEWVVAGLACGFALTYAIGLACSLAVLRHACGQPPLRQLAVSYAFRVAAAVPAGGAAVVIADRVLGHWGNGVAVNLVALGCATIVFGATYCAIDRGMQRIVRRRTDPPGVGVRRDQANS